MEYRNDPLVTGVMSRMCCTNNPVLVPVMLLDHLKYVSEGIGMVFEAESINFPESIDEEDDEWLKGKRFDGVCFYCQYYGDPIFMSNHDFYGLLCEYTEKAVSDLDDGFKKAAGELLEKFRDKHKLK